MQRERTLLERIADPRAGEPRTVSESTQRIADSVLRHLRRMLNTWHGHTLTLPDYGIPNLSELVHSFPESIALMQRAIKRSIEEYEPRLRRVRVRPAQSEEDLLTLHFEISADLVTAGEKAAIRLDTRVDSVGRMQVLA